MNLSNYLNQKAFLTFVVALVAAAGVTFAYVEDARIAEELRLRAALVSLGGSPDIISADTHALYPLFILICGFGLALLVFIAFHSLWRERAVAEKSSTNHQLSKTRSQERLRSLFDNAGEGICGLNQAGEIIFINPAGASILGAPREELMQRTFASFLVNGSDKSKDTGDLQNDVPNQTDYSLVTVGGQKLTIDLTTSPMRGQSEFSTGSVVIFRDITSRVEAETKLRDANAELEEFAYRTSHDLRSPIVSAVALMKSVSASLEKENLQSARKGLKLSVRALEALENLVEDIMALSRTKAEVEEDASIQFAPLVQQAMERHTYLEGYERLTIAIDFRDPKGIVSKPHRVNLIVNNLISNAIKYHDPAEQEPRLAVSTWAEGNEVFLAVEDNGLGIPENQRENMFTMFKRFHPRVSFGSGLGLYMVRKSAEIIGARIEYQPCEQGTRFTVVFPQITEAQE